MHEWNVWNFSRIFQLLARIWSTLSWNISLVKFKVFLKKILALKDNRKGYDFNLKKLEACLKYQSSLQKTRGTSVLSSSAHNWLTSCKQGEDFFIIFILSRLAVLEQLEPIQHITYCTFKHSVISNIATWALVWNWPVVMQEEPMSNPFMEWQTTVPTPWTGLSEIKKEQNNEAFIMHQFQYRKKTL